MAEEMRTFGYVCPGCGKPVTGSRSSFALEASDAEIVCECGGSVLHTDFDGQRFTLSVPCGICGKTHTAVCAADRILRAASAFGCPETRQFCCFVGTEGIVEKNLRELTVLIEKEKNADESAEQAFLDSVIMYEVLSELRDIASRPDGIVCGCGSRGYRMEVRRSSVDLVCQSCGAKLRIPAATDRDLDDLCCRMKLRIPGEPSGE